MSKPCTSRLAALFPLPRGVGMALLGLALCLPTLSAQAAQAGLAAAGAAPGQVQSASTNTGPAASEVAPLAVALSYVPPPFVGGSKVRTPESTATLLVEEVAKELNRRPNLVELDATAASLPAADVDFAVVDLPREDVKALEQGLTAIATGQVTRPMAIMRTDTDIKSWKQLKGRTVCVSEDGRYVGRIAQQYGAIEQIYRAPADSLLALRIGECDAAVHDDILLKALLRFPEWKKFSASLTPGEPAAQYFLVPGNKPQLVKALEDKVKHWKAQGHYRKLMAVMTRDIAFEVYLDQEVPDCH